VSVSIKRGEGQLRKADLNISEIAAEHDGINSKALHLGKINKHRLPEGVTPEKFVENHIKRMEALASRGVVEQIHCGNWRVLKDKVVNLANQEGDKGNYVSVKLESMQNIKQ
jgi:hypothetical protein